MKNKFTQILFVLLMLASSIIQAQVDTLIVTKITDPDPFLYKQNPNDPVIIGTLQWAVRKSNDSPGFSVIKFNIPGSGLHFITLKYLLPASNDSLLIDGTTQQGYSYGNPQIIIRANLNLNYGFYFSGKDINVKGIELRGFNSAITNSGNNGKIENNVLDSCTQAYLYFYNSSCNIFGNTIKTDLHPLQAGYGIIIKGSVNCKVGGTNLNEGNQVYSNSYSNNMYGVYISTSNNIKISGNKIYNNQYGIYNYSSNNNKMPPTITGYNSNGIISGTSQPFDIIEIFGSTGTENANKYLLSATANANGNWVTSATYTTFPYFIATATDLNNNTSVFSSIFSSIPPIAITFTTTDASCNGAADGSANAIVSGGFPPYNYLWSNGQTTATATGLSSGVYTVIVTDNLNNTASEATSINEPPLNPITTTPACSELFVSEYVEGGVHNQALEIYNPTNSDILLNRYFLRIYSNGAPTHLITQLNGAIPPKQTFVIASPNADVGILNVANQTSNKINFNGDDPIQLIKVLNNITINVDSIEIHGGNPHDIFDTIQLAIIDQIGIPGVDPGNHGYNVGTNGTTKNSTLRKNASVSSGTNDWTCGQMQWNVYSSNNLSGLGNHQNICPTCISFTDTVSPWYVKGEIIVKFDTSCVIRSAVDDINKQGGLLIDFIKPNVLNAMNIKAQFSISQCPAFKIFKNMSTTDTISISRLNEEIKVPPFWTMFRISLPCNSNEKNVCDSLYKLYPQITSAVRNHIYVPNALPNDPLLNYQASLVPNSTYSSANINIEPAWNITTGEDYVKVGVIDFPVYWAHEDFGDGTFSGSNIKGGKDYGTNVDISNVTDIIDSHGTSCAGIIGALRNNAKGIAGIAGGDVATGKTGVSLYSLGIYSRYTDPNSGAVSIQAFMSDVLPAIYDAATSSPNGYGLNIINCSWGRQTELTGTDSALAPMVEYCYRNKCIMVASRGNDGNSNPRYPACFNDDWVISVGASGFDGLYKSASNGDLLFSPWASSYGGNVDVIAPGCTEIIAAPYNPSYPYLWNNILTTPGYYTFSGTSAAAPHVAGIVALMYSKHNTHNGYYNLATEDVEFILQKYASHNGNYYDDYNGWGLVNAGNAVQKVNGPQYRVFHSFVPDVVSQTITADVPVFVFNNVGGIATGPYTADKYTVIHHYQNNFPSNEQILNFWPRLSSCIGISAAQSIENEDTYASFSSTINAHSATVDVTTYCWYVKYDAFQHPVYRWIPAPPNGLKTAYSLHIFDINASGIDENELNSEVHLYPIPASDLINISYSINKLENVTIEMFDISGRLVMQAAINKSQIGENNQSLNVSKLSTGLYSCRIKIGENIITKRFIKE